MILYALPPCNGGQSRGSPPALMQGTGGQCILVLLPAALWPWGGEWGGGLQPLSSGIGSPSPSHHGRAEGLEALGAEVRTVLWGRKAVLPTCPLAAPG